MFTQCTQEKLSAALQITERFSGKNTTLPILENIFVTAEKGFFTLAATNLEVGVIIKITAKTEKNGKGIVPARILSSFVYNLPQDGVVSLEKKEIIPVVGHPRPRKKRKNNDGAGRRIPGHNKDSK